MLVLIWACRVRGDPAGEERPGGGPAAGAARRDFWGLLVSKVVRGLKGPTGWSEGKDWALATRLAGPPFSAGLKEELGCRKKQKEMLAVRALGAPFPGTGGDRCDLWTSVGSGRASDEYGRVPQAKIFKWNCNQTIVLLEKPTSSVPR